MNEQMKKGERQDKTQRLVMVLINMPGNFSASML